MHAPLKDASLIIPLANLAIAFIPAVVALVICYKWSNNVSRAGVGVARMLAQLLLIGYCLNFVFGTDNGLLVSSILLAMLLVASWISVGSLVNKNTKHRVSAFLAIAVGGVSTLVLITQGVLQLEPWYLPKVMIPIAGMIFASSMNSVSLAAERLESEMLRDSNYREARATAFNASLIPIINSLFAVGLVSLPGMMTGQILSGVSPLIAVRYQIMVMCMIFGASALAAACFLKLLEPKPNELSQ